ncbi:YqiA/YcfP family alpha/beta fold hydrolase [Pedobacter agri]|uniref:YqiA/YcfP family alpha/beta fold hydrolase n=1 Tax=Pedobacter agri TaxID=454586 RepID=UPI00292D0C0D|nr:YqiA/YcfP family alpha/beta fold hydrolase [Pedobacter agri]
MKILYFHGLDGHLSDDKRVALEKYGAVIGPQINYRLSDRNVEILTDQYHQEQIDIVIGNSMGGLMAYHISLAYGTPCLIFNPALPYTSVPQQIPDIRRERTEMLQIVLGKLDEVINYHDTMKFLEETVAPNVEYKLHIHSTLPHRIDIATFEEELDSFFRSIENFKPKL